MNTNGIDNGTLNEGGKLKDYEIQARFQDILIYNGFTFSRNCKGAKYANYIVKDIDIIDSGFTNNVTSISDFFEGIHFIRDGYSFKKISIDVYLIENGKTLEQLISEIKANFSEIKGELQYFYKGEMMTLEVIRDGNISFDLNNDPNYFTLNFIGQPFFKSNKEIIVSGTINGTSGNIIENNEGQRADVVLTITPNGDSAICGGLKIGEFLIDKDIEQGETIIADFKTGKVTLEGNSVGRKGSLPLLKNNINIPIEFQDKIIYETYDQILDSLDGNDGSSTYSILYNNYDGHYIKHYFPTLDINYLKEIQIGFENEYNIGIKMNIYLYDGVVNNPGNQITPTITKYFYAGENVESVPVTLDGSGIDISAYSHLYIVVRIDPITYSSSNPIIWSWLKTGNGVHGIGTSYNHDGDDVDWTWNINLKGSSTPYETTSTNISSFDYQLNYFNKYI